MPNDTTPLSQEPITGQQPSVDFSAGALQQRFAQMFPEGGASQQQQESTAQSQGQEAAQTTTQQSEAAATTQQSSQEPAQQQEQLSPQKLKWNELKSKADEYDKLKAETLPQKEKELAELKAKVDSLSAVDAKKFEAEIKAREEQIARYEQRLAIFDIRESRQFQEEIMRPIEGINNEVDTIAASYGMNGADLRGLWGIQDPVQRRTKLQEAMAEFSDDDRADIRAAMKRFDEIAVKAMALEQNAAHAKKELEYMQEQERQQKAEERMSNLRTSGEVVQKQFRNVLPDLTKDEKVAADIFGVDLSEELSPAMEAYNRMSGRAVFHLSQQVKQKEAKIAELEKALADRSSVSPKAGGGQSAQQQAQASSQQQQQPSYNGESVWQRARQAGIAKV